MGHLDENLPLGCLLTPRVATPSARGALAADGGTQAALRAIASSIFCFDAVE